MGRFESLAMRATGLWWHGSLAVLVGVFLAAPARAADPRPFEIPAQSLSAALLALAEHADISIGLTDVSLNNRTSRPLTEYRGVKEALEQLLAGSGLGFQMVDAATWRIVPLAQTETPRTKTAATIPLTLPPIEEITVTASKRPVALQAAPLSIVAVAAKTFSDYGIQSSQEMTSLVAGLTATNQGPGKNKFIVRGLSDGPFIGNTQSTVGVYLDETRAIYNAPDPNLQLFDVDRVEVIRGPQGTLYGAGSIAGLVRIITRQPVFGAFQAQGLVDGSVTEHGDPSGAIEAMANVPLVGDRLAWRTVAYARHDGGYIDNSFLGKNRVNDSDIRGARSSLRLRLSPKWTVSAGVVAQSIHARDTQYFSAAMGPFRRGNFLPEPSKNDFLDLNVAIDGDLGWAELVSTTAWLSHQVNNRFDASLALPSLIRAPVMPTLYDQRTRYRTLNHETRLVSAATARLQWLGGFFVSRHSDQSNANLMLTGPAPDTFYVKNRLDHGTELAAFGEVKYRVTPRLSVSLGARLYHGAADVAANNSEMIDVGPADAVGENRKTGVTPKAEIAFQMNPGTLFYAQISQGFRLGGINIASRVTTTAPPGRRPVTVSNFDSDRLWNFEIGTKTAFLDQRLLVNASAFYAIWNNMQADLIRTNGLSFTGNLGNAQIGGFEVEATFAPNEHFRIFGNAGWSNPKTPDTADSLASSITSRLPGAPKLTGTIAAQYQRNLGADYAGYVNIKYALSGRAHLTVGSLPMSAVPAYHAVNLRAGVRHGPWELAAYVNNVTDNRTNTYAFGNPFSLGRISQVIPLQPRTIGITLRWAE